MSSETQKADLSSLRINRNALKSNGSGTPKKKLILYSSLGAGVIIVAALFVFGGGMSSAEQVETTTVSLAYRSQANTVLTASVFASEIWVDADQLMLAFNRPVYSALTVKLKNVNDFDAFKSRLEGNQRLVDLEPKREKVFYQEQSQGMAVFIRVLRLIITIIFSAGAMIGAMITMYAAVANRTVEIGTMRGLGFRRRSILAAFLLEAIFLSLLGGVLGLVLAFFLEFVSFSTTNFGTFSELAFGFHLTPMIVVFTLFFSLFMGVIGGFLPAVRAARLNIINALRAS